MYVTLDLDVLWESPLVGMYQPSSRAKMLTDLSEATIRQLHYPKLGSEPAHGISP